MISTKAKKGDLRPKNIIDHSMFKTSWMENHNKATLTSVLRRVFCHTRKRDIPMVTNKLIQTGENTQFGGLKDGLLRLAYQVGIDGEVNKDPTNPAN